MRKSPNPQNFIQELQKTCVKFPLECNGQQGLLWHRKIFKAPEKFDVAYRNENRMTLINVL